MDTGGEIQQTDSIAAIFLERVRTDLKSPALWTRTANTAYQSSTWEGLLLEVASTAAALAEQGVTQGTRVVQLSENRREWITLDLALQFLGAWHVPISTHASPSQIRQILEHCDPAMIVVESTHKDGWIAKQAADCVKTLAYDDDGLWPSRTLSDLVAILPTTVELALADLQHRAEQINPDDVCSLVYTSGTTGPPKGVMLTHRNLAFNAMAVVHAYEEKPADKRLSFLPFSHLYARTCDVYTWMARGSQLALAHSRETILADCQAIKPTLINGVPYFYQKVVEGLKANGKLDMPGALQTALGGEVRMCASGGAPLAGWVIEAFAKQGLSLLEGYGMTEASPVISVSTEGAHRAGSVGKKLEGIEVRISEQGELETRGPHVMKGYYQDEAATQQVMDGDWLRTGDIGMIDDEGFLWITGRHKEMLVLSTGRKVNPDALELAIVSDPLVAQVVVCGEGRKCLSALIVPDPNQLRQRIKEARLWVFSKRQALQHPAVRAWYRDVLDCQLANRADYEQVGPFTILGQGFTPATGEMTTKLSLRRDAIMKNHHFAIEQMYKPPEVSPPWWQFWAS
ncbi:Long-chain-fatty-acid--CoA ligase FadD15 [Bremerella volcania]|uniref:Long-chain-fatty-acid--CoA ligase FadD15 n=1 Tax=Bremerella volcania TaxID=2527984 RepID=A0A518CD59_9BACT|nr:AMP-dependent synthetase/ligase [Bremerella volcania]QDU77169.1 Long-chain-fatty-acid--CoA ligase FadD15 [Bremerella volcania]